ncbi:MAG: hypothetical protein COU90_01050 [Candidatus Ryanbacteria bacterium CG10_big_fil_rev_8_21_14_0_10_43_42]|uniref:DoxX family protein n=1 Tax=Candidatus Ryanbacteria bacterium CG10_big_fil_rev_8_21_14_0_10_43_42 TaxID=1974864 RepID=A0A2M8KY23_9BACT|nr:MAG: hypothetical protein COU90_01050 [Candidatus Ryanbacteria bacterium CG10_big_fil_rev_8_21_14_0_10_43_42]
MPISPSIPLRLGLGAMYLYSGFDLVRNPDNWISFIPGWFMDVLMTITTLETFLRLQGVVELLFAFIFLSLFLPQKGVRVAAVFSALEICSILVFTGVDLITFRDFGLLGASVALIILLKPQEPSIFVPEGEHAR